MLVVNVALEECCHWLEGTEQPFVVWTGHKNLAYDQSAKRPNSCHTYWVLFFSCLNLTLTYRPNVKLDALSQQHTSEEPLSCPDTILPSSGVVAALTWEIESVVREDQ